MILITTTAVSEAVFNTTLAARQFLAHMELSAKNRAFLDKSFDVVEDKPINEIVVSSTAKGAKVVIYFTDGDRREFAAG